jgi:hypothetical protein
MAVWGVDCDRYHGDARLFAGPPGAQATDLWRGRESMGVEVWIDDAGLIRSAHVLYSESSSGREVSLVTTLQLAEFGVPYPTTPEQSCA